MATVKRLAVLEMLHVSKELKPAETKLIFDISQFCVNEHSYKHRPSCFKKGHECRFNYPCPLNDEWKYDYGLTEDTEMNELQRSSYTKLWAQLDGIKTANGFIILPKRDACDIFMNVHNTSLLMWNGYNNNSQMGDTSHLFYNTMYATKHAVDEDTTDHSHTLQYARWNITKQMENYYKENPELSPDITHEINDFKLGFQRVLRGITGHLCESVISSNLAAHIVSTGTRFHFSHDFSNIMLKQFEEYFAGNYVEYTMRWSREKQTGYVDSSVFDYIYRPQSLSDLCLYEFMSLYDSVPKHQTNHTNPDILEFLEPHPAKTFKVLKLRSTTCIPIIESCHFGDLRQLLSNTPDLQERQVYAKKAMLLFMSFRSMTDLYEDSSENNVQSTWDKFMSLINGNDTSKFWRTGVSILQNQQDRVYNVQNLFRIPDSIQRKTVLKSTEGKSKNSSDDEITDIIGEGSFLSSISADLMIDDLFQHSTTDNDIRSTRNDQTYNLNYEIPFIAKRIELTDDDDESDAEDEARNITIQPTRRMTGDNIIRIAIGSFLPSLSTTGQNNVDPLSNHTEHNYDC